jgi:hypothetical protein
MRLRRLTNDYLAPIVGPPRNDWERQVVIGLFVLSRGKISKMKELYSNPGSFRVKGLFEFKGSLRPSVAKLLPLVINYMEAAVEDVPDKVNRLLNQVSHPYNEREVIKFTMNAIVVADDLLRNSSLFELGD